MNFTGIILVFFISIDILCQNHFERVQVDEYGLCHLEDLHKITSRHIPREKYLIF